MNMHQGTAVAPGRLALSEWLQELRTGLAVRSQFVVAGNIRDLFPVPAGEELSFLPSTEAIWSVLGQQGYAGLLKYDPIDGTKLHHECAEELLPALRDAGIDLDAPPRDLKALANNLRLVASSKPMPIAFILDYASQLCGQSHELDSDQRDFFITCDKIAHSAAPLRCEERPANLPYNPIIWMMDRPNDLPEWFAVGNETIRPLSANLPDLEERFALAQTTLLAFPDIANLSAEECKRDMEQFALETDGMTLRSVLAISELAHAEGIGLRNVSDAVRAYKIGTPSNPWKAHIMRGRIADGQRILQERVKGQERAVRKALDILIRSAMGLSGSQTSSRHGRPRGVLFFAGPTGVGKTELAKAVTELLFGDETSYHRFDMSEFSSENSESRLTGAPPGYLGHQDGGELVNAARSRPFSVFLFDEIEKAHPRILDKFLQIIDEGRLTDGRGETVYFSESLIIFTSNIGIFGHDKATNLNLNILPSDTYDEIERKIVGAIREYFRFELQRPELINRIGRNIVVFEFIRSRSAVLILENMMKKVFAAVSEEHGVQISLSNRAMEQIAELCTYDLFDGGRGIGNRLEAVLINPLARLLFQRDGEAGKLKITGIEERGGEYRLRSAD